MIAPEIALGCLALLLLVAELIMPPKRRLAWLGNVAPIGVFLIFIFTAAKILQPDSEMPAIGFGGLIGIDSFSLFIRALLLFVASIILYLGNLYFDRLELPKLEFNVLVIIATAGMMLMSCSRNFAMLFVALETVTIAFYILVAYRRTSVLSLEAGLKYVILGGVSSSILLFGIVLLYGAAGNPLMNASTANGLDFKPLGAFVAENPDYILVQLGAALVVAGLAFKIGAVPFHVWIPDVYHGAPTPTTAFLAVSSKTAGFAALVLVVSGPLRAIGDFLIPLLSAITIVTILYGNLTSLVQENLKRLIGLSGISHAGYLLLGVTAIAAGVENAEWAVLVYLATYLFGSFCVFSVMLLVNGDEDTIMLTDHRGLMKRNGLLATVLTIGLASLAGIPPLAGFIGKLFVFAAAAKAHLWAPLIAAAIGVAISIYYYFGWIREAVFSDKLAASGDLKPIHVSPDHKVALGLMAAATVLIGLIQAI